MKTADKKHLLKWNTILWLLAMVLPVGLSFAFASAKFPWQMIVPMLLFALMLASNNMLTKAIGETTDDSSPK